MTPILDEATTVDEKLGRIEQLLESQLAQDGVTEVQHAPNPTPFEYSTVPREGARQSIPLGETTIDFQNGTITNQYEGQIGELRDFDDMSQGIDSTVQNLRSIWMYADAPIQAQLDSGEWFTIEPGTFHPLVSQGFTNVTIQADVSVEMYAVASTRAQSFTDSDSVSVDVKRYADDRYTSDPPDSFEALEFSTTDMIKRNTRNWQNSYGKTRAFVGHCDSMTLIVRNDSDAANAIDVRIMGAHTEELQFAEISRATGIDQGDHHVFHVDQSHRWIQAQFRNSTNGNTVSTEITLHGGA